MSRISHAFHPEKIDAVALFITCLNDQFFPRVGVAMTRILESLGLRVEFPHEQTCCGQPFFNAGQHAEAADLARRFVQIFRRYECIVTPSASCCAMVREHFPALLRGDHVYDEARRRVCGRTYEFVEFIHDVLKVDLRRLSLPRPTRVAWHFSCHQRLIGMSDQTQRLLRQMGNLELVSLERADECCGFGGAFAVEFAPVSGSIVTDKVESIVASGAEAVVCNDAGCALNIAGAARRLAPKVRVVHIAELIAEAMGLPLDRL